MAYIALYRKWRPMNFDQVVEQDAVVTILKNSVTSGRIAHAYLFCGTRGTGKTTIAKIFARAVNCPNNSDGNPCNQCSVCQGIINQQILDVSEIDAASNNGVDNIRSIIDETVYSSTVAKYRVYIIDEVHMLSAGAFNALLKTLEEPPPDVIFILATTEPHKLPVTILSRCQRYDFKRISREGIIGRLEHICKAQEIEYELPALAYIAQKADGGMRDAISLLDQTISASPQKLTLKSARDASGSLDKEFLDDFLENLLLSRGADILMLTDRIFAEGRDPSVFIGELINILRSMLIVITVRNPETLIYEDEEGMEVLRRLCSYTNSKEVCLMIQELSALDNRLKWSVQRKIIFEAGMLSLCDRKWEIAEADYKERIAVLENRVSDLVASGVKVAAVSGALPQSQGAMLLKQEARQEVAEKEDILPPPNKKESEEPEKKVTKPSENGSPVKASVPDWDDFLGQLRDRKRNAFAGILSVAATGWVTGDDQLLLVFENESMSKAISGKKEDMEIMEGAAAAAFGKALTIRIMTLGEFKSGTWNLKGGSGIDEEKKIDHPDEFDIALAKLKNLSDAEGFEISVKS